MGTGSSFNWVVERSRCSLPHIFNTLAEMIETDVTTANDLKFPNLTFTLIRISEDKITVTRLKDYSIAGSGPLPERMVTVEIDGAAITFKEGTQNKALLFTAAPAINENRECIMLVDDKPYKLWQIRQKALDSLFFAPWR
jgi:hypothetical protein